MNHGSGGPEGGTIPPLLVLERMLREMPKPRAASEVTVQSSGTPTGYTTELPDLAHPAGGGPG